MRLCKSYPAEIMEAASKEALDRGICSFKYINIIVKQVAAKSQKQQVQKIIMHENIRGKNAYAGGGINA